MKTCRTLCKYCGGYLKRIRKVAEGCSKYRCLDCYSEFILNDNCVRFGNGFETKKKKAKD